ERIAQLQRETAAVSALLAQVFTEDQTDDHFSDSPISSAPANTSESAACIEAGRVDEQVTSSDIPGLDLEHSAFLRLLMSRTEWSRSELEEAASDMELMLDGALEQINDMGFDRFNMPVTEGDDPVEINADILEELTL
ncbi:Tellurite resistance protein TerB, partial [Pseudomonas coronafaciens]